MTKYKKFRRCLATAPVKIISESDLVIFAIPPPVNGPTNDVDSVLWAIAVAMSRAPDPGSTQRSAPKVSQPSEILQVASLRRHTPRDDANGSVLETAEHLINAWNKTNQSQMLQPFVLTSSGWERFDTVSRTARTILLRLDDAICGAYVPRHMVPSEQSQPQSSTSSAALQVVNPPSTTSNQSQSITSPAVLQHASRPSTSSHQPRPRIISIPEGLRVNPTQGPFNDGLAELPPGVMFLYPEDTTAEEMKRRPRANLLKGLWDVSAIVVPPGAILKDSQGAVITIDPEAQYGAEDRA